MHLQTFIVSAAQLQQGSVELDITNWVATSVPALSCVITNNSNVTVTEQSSGTPVASGIQAQVIGFPAGVQSVQLTCGANQAIAGTVVLTAYDQALAPAPGAANSPAVTLTGPTTVSISGTPNINVAGQSITVATLSNQSVLGTITVPAAGSLPLTTNVPVPAGIHSLLVYNHGPAGPGAPGNVTLRVVGHTSGSFFVPGNPTINVPVSGNDVTISGEGVAAGVAVPSMDATIDVIIDGGTQNQIISIIGIPYALASIIVNPPVITQSNANSLAIVGPALGPWPSSTVQAGRTYSWPSEGTAIAAADRPIDTFQITSNPGTGVALALSQAAPGAGLHNIITSFDLQIVGIGGAVGAGNVAVVLQGKTIKLNPAVAQNADWNIHAENLRLDCGANTAATLSLGALVNGYIVGVLRGFVASSPNS